MRNKTKKIILRTFLGLIILGMFFIHFYVPRVITEIKNPLLVSIKGQYIPQSHFVSHPHQGEFIRFKSFDDTSLSAFITYTDSIPAKGTIILLHGIRSTKEHFIGMSQKLAIQGYQSVALDLRAHGQSKGQYCTFGVKEKKDISALINILENNERVSENIGIWGQSLGGAIALQALGSDYRLAFGVVESTFSDFETITHDYMAYHLGFNSKHLTKYLVNRAGKISDFNPNDAEPSQYCKSIDQPILIVHGSDDKRINIKYGLQNFSNIISTRKQFLEIEKANHLNVWKIGGEKYFEQVLQFISPTLKVDSIHHKSHISE